MHIEEGKFYKTRDGRKVGPMKFRSGGSWATAPNEDVQWHIQTNVDFADHSGKASIFGDGPDDLVAEWPEFKVGDVIAWNNPELSEGIWQNFRIVTIGGECYGGVDSVNGTGILLSSWDLRLVESTQIPEIKPEIDKVYYWHGQKEFPVTVLGFTSNGRAILKSDFDDEVTRVGEVFVFEQDDFLHFYKPEFVEEVPKTTVKWINVIGKLWSKESSVDPDLFDTEEVAKKNFEEVYDAGDYKLIATIKIEFKH